MASLNKIDCHIHTKFSPDGSEEPEAIITAAIERGVSHMAFTDHLDIDLEKPEKTSFDILKKNRDVLLKLKEKYRGRIYVSVGIECGWTKKTEKALTNLLNMLNYEYVINSVHEYDGMDCYYQIYFENKTKEKAYGDFFGAVLKSLDAPYEFHAVGHLSYPERTAPYENKKIRYKDFSGILDEILIKIIEKGAALELNTNIYNALSATLPDSDILMRYKELGGKYITFSSDMHKIQRLLDNYSAASTVAVNAGFKEWTVIQNGKKVLIPIN